MAIIIIRSSTQHHTPFLLPMHEHAHTRSDFIRERASSNQSGKTQKKSYEKKTCEHDLDARPESICVFQSHPPATCQNSSSSSTIQFHCRRRRRRCRFCVISFPHTLIRTYRRHVKRPRRPFHSPNSGVPTSTRSHSAQYKYISRIKCVCVCVH